MLFNTSANKDSFLLSTITISFYFSSGGFWFNICRNYSLNIGSCIESATVDLLMFSSGKKDLSENMFCWLEGPISSFPPPTPLQQRRVLIFISVFFQIYSKIFLSSKQKTVALLIWGSRRVVAICLFSYRLFLMLFHD